MSNFLTDNPDLLFTLKNLDLEEVVAVRENNYTESEKFDTAPVDYADACDNFERVLTVVGDVTGERIAPRSRQVDEEGPKCENGVVTYHPLTVKNLQDLKNAGLTGVILSRKYGGLNFPTSLSRISYSLRISSVSPGTCISLWAGAV